MGTIHILVLLGGISISSATSVLQYFIGHADCSGVPYGWLVKNPLDCGSYFVCEDEIQYERCPSLLHFDAEKRVCNWPDKAKCDWTVLPPIIIPGDFETSLNPKTTKATTTRPTTSTSNNPETKKPTTTTRKTTIKTTTPRTTTATRRTIPIITTTSRPTTTTRRITSTTTQKSAKTTTQRPRPATVLNPDDDIQMRWICENVVLKDTKIGEDESKFGAYDKESGKTVDPMTTFNPKKVSCLYDGVYFLPHPTACDNYYICSHRTLIAHSCGSGVSWNYKTNRCDVTLKSACFKKENEKPVGTTTSSTIEKVTRHVTAEKPKTTRNDKLPVCPMNVQTYYPHSEDCRKYYICIAGLPVLTTCPDELYWDDTHKFCGLPQYTECKANQK